ncbi:LOB domain-containing protein 6 [Rhynchospora pubera]|uniref:LOB domain-containing protein 6 n=2 Tax=Rhynchospora pubera TaxID=906938 RepID=A0AAV8F3D4_9POAL|nr:LOB domain-containing protein 6 [Rhynchospora pubera]
MATSHNPSLLISSTSSNLCYSTITGAGSLPGSNTTSSPCAACKFLRRKCQPDCVFAPYFPPDNPTKFQNVHKVFGASNVTKLLNELQPYQREDAVNSLAYEAEMRLRDPVYGCVGVISVLHHQLRQLQDDLNRARVELARYQAAANLIGNIGPGSALHAGTGFGHEQFFQPQNGTNHQTMFRGLETGGINVAYNDSSLAAAIGFGSLTSGGLHFLKPSTVGGDERPSQVLVPF